jgi:hypothetical protein
MQLAFDESESLDMLMFGGERCGQTRGNKLAQVET